ncbi:MAG: hypothetical protein JSU74_02930 [Candidatus Zixiibacteriota bacterium]|nr:MAG: hypothetical protein JSU74_02930 [candidate division Zixibacteria bacterium]
MRTSARTHLYRLTLIFALTLLASTGCKKPDDAIRGHDYATPMTYFPKCVSHRFVIDSLPYAQLTRITYSAGGISDTSVPTDEEGIRMSQYDGSLYYHPVYMCHVAYELVAAYRKTADSAHLELAKKYVNRLILNGTEYDGAIYYDYPIDYKVHRMERAFLKAPWHSGMAQGEILGLLVRMFWVTGDSIYIDYAGKTFKSFLRPRGQGGPWTVFVDSKGCYWIEEYPTEIPSQTLNGFIYALYGLYDYYLLTRSDDVEEILQKSLSTLKNYIPLYRRPGKPSFYNLTYRHWSKRYHRMHIEQCRQLYKITKDEFFNEWADIFEQDFSS